MTGVTGVEALLSLDCCILIRPSVEVGVGVARVGGARRRRRRARHRACARATADGRDATVLLSDIA